MSTAETCAACGYIHGSADVLALGRFTSEPTYLATIADTVHPTRADADTANCRHRQQRQQRQQRPNAPATTPQPQPAASNAATGATGTPPAPAPFPAALFETGARAKAWRDFLAQVAFSLAVWQLDDTLHGQIEHPLAWLRRCRDELEIAS